MKLPAQGTTERKLLDHLFAYHPRSSRSIKQIQEKLGTGLSTSSLQAVIESEQMEGRIINRRSGFALSAESRKAFYAEKTVMPTPSVRNVLTGPPLHPSRYLKVTSNRDDDCDKWRDYKSLTAPFTKSA